MRADEFEGFGNLIFPASDRITEGMTVSDTARLLPFHSNVNPADVARTVDRMLIAVRSGQLTFHPLYSEDQIADDPDKAVVGLFFFRGGTNAPLSIISAGGGFSYVGSFHEGFPHAQTIADHGENAFVLNYRTGSGGRLAAEDLAVAIDFAFANAHELDVDPTGYALWGSSAGARIAAVLGSHGTIAFGQCDRPRPSAVIMAYTGHSDISGTVPPTFAVVGSDDVIAPSWLVRQHIDRLRLAGVRTEFHAFPNIGHGFGLGTGTAAEGWIDDALAFWRTNRISAGVGNDAGSGPITVRSLRARVLSQSCSSGGKGTRTPNPLLAKQMRYQLRHTPVRVLTLTPNRCARTIRPGRLGSHAATGRRFRVPRA